MGVCGARSRRKEDGVAEEVSLRAIIIVSVRLRVAAGARLAWRTKCDREGGEVKLETVRVIWLICLPFVGSFGSV